MVEHRTARSRPPAGVRRSVFPGRRPLLTMFVAAAVLGAALFVVGHATTDRGDALTVRRLAVAVTGSTATAVATVVAGLPTQVDALALSVRDAAGAASDFPLGTDVRTDHAGRSVFAERTMPHAGVYSCRLRYRRGARWTSTAARAVFRVGAEAFAPGARAPGGGPSGNPGTPADPGAGQPPADGRSGQPPADGKSGQPPAEGAATGVAIPGTEILYADPAVIDRDLDRVDALGVTWLRFDAAWSEIEGRPGVRDWSRVDSVVDAARSRGLSIVLILGSSAPSSRPPDADWNYGPRTAAQRAAFADFAAAAATRYRGQVHAYEIWNEPNLPGSWAPYPDAGAYLKLLKATYAQIHAVDPAATVVSGGTGGGATGVDTATWYERLYAGGLHASCDAVAVHPYPDAPTLDSGELATARKVRALMDANGDRSKRLWGTETGAPTGGEPSIDEGTQGTLAGQLFQVWTTMEEPGPLLYYTLNDFGGSDREGHFGLLRTDGSAKPSYRAVQAWSAR